MTIPRFQLFQFGDRIEHVCITSITESDNTNSYYVCMEDIQDVFSNARRFKLDNYPVPFLKAPNGNRYQPLRIAFYPGKTLEVITDSPEFTNITSVARGTGSLPQFSRDLPSYSQVMSDDATTIKRQLEDIKLKSNPEHRQRTTNMNDGQDITINKGNSSTTIQIQKQHRSLTTEARGNNENSAQIHQQPQANSNLAKFQSQAQAILAQCFEIHECPIPRLFVILPVDNGTWNSHNILRNKPRLYFLCDCGDEMVKASQCFKNHIHIADHEGYEIQNTIEFYHRYGKRILILLYALKARDEVADESFTATHVPKFTNPGIQLAIAYLTALSIETPILENISTLDDYEELKGESLQQLQKFTQINDENKNLGDLYRIVSDTGHTKWVCHNHLCLDYKEYDQKMFASMIKADGWCYDHHLGKVIIKANSTITAKEIFDSLARLSRVYELEVKFDWDFTIDDLNTLKDGLAGSQISILHIDLSRHRLGAFHNHSSLLTEYETIVKITELQSMRIIHIILGHDMIELSHLQLNRASHLHKFSYELTPRAMGLNEFMDFTDTLCSNKYLTVLNLSKNMIGMNGAVYLSEALLTNTTLTTLNLYNNEIGNDGVIALSESLKINTSLRILILEKNLIQKEGAIALSRALKINTSLTSLNLEINSIGKEGAIALSEALLINTSLTILNLENNAVGDEGAIALSEALKTKTSLTTLILDFNLIGNEGAFALSEALKTNTSLKTLIMGFNSIEDEGAIALSEALKINTSLTTLNVVCNPILTEGTTALSEVLNSSTSLKDLEY